MSVLTHVNDTANTTSAAAWASLAVQAAHQLVGVAASHPNQKKVFSAIITKPMLMTVAQAIWPGHTCSTAARDNSPAQKSGGAEESDASKRHSHTTLLTYQGEGPMTVILKQLLHQVIFHPSNLDGLLELSSSQPDSQGNQSSGTPCSYHFQLLQVMLTSNTCFLHVYMRHA